jgi:hypothetical protein
MISAKIVERPARFDRVDRVKEAVGQPVLADDDRFWILGGRLVAQVGVKEWIEIPVGFTTDGASVPRWAQELTKSHADNVFRAVLVSKGAGPLTGVPQLR